TFVGDITGPTTNVHEKYYDLTLHATSEDVTLLWGGHLASAANWGKGLGAGSISGAPFHMAISRMIDGKETSSQDRSIHLDESTVESHGNLSLTKVVDSGNVSADDFSFT